VRSSAGCLASAVADRPWRALVLVADRPDTLRRVCGLRGDETLATLVAEEFAALACGWFEGNSLVSLERRLWTWMPPASEQLERVAA
jgi:hypothetical protein